MEQDTPPVPSQQALDGWARDPPLRRPGRVPRGRRSSSLPPPPCCRSCATFNYDPVGRSPATTSAPAPATTTTAFARKVSAPILKSVRLNYDTVFLIWNRAYKLFDLKATLLNTMSYKSFMKSSGNKLLNSQKVNCVSHPAFNLMDIQGITLSRQLFVWRKMHATGATQAAAAAKLTWNVCAALQKNLWCLTVLQKMIHTKGRR